MRSDQGPPDPPYHRIFPFKHCPKCYSDIDWLPEGFMWFIGCSWDLFHDSLKCLTLFKHGTTGFQWHLMRYHWGYNWACDFTMLCYIGAVLGTIWRARNYKTTRYGALRNAEKNNTWQEKRQIILYGARAGKIKAKHVMDATGRNSNKIQYFFWFKRWCYNNCVLSL